MSLLSLPGRSLADAANDDDPRLVRVQRSDSSVAPPASSPLPAPAVEDPDRRRQPTGDVRSVVNENGRRSEDSNASLGPVSVDGGDQRSTAYRGRYLQQDVTATAAAAASLALRVWDLQARQQARHGPRPRTCSSGHAEQVGPQQTVFIV